MNSTVLQNAFWKSRCQNYDIILPNIHLNSGCELDLLCLKKSGYIEEVEIKISIADFKADFNKTVGVKKRPETDNHRFPYHVKIETRGKHDALIDGQLIQNYFSFLIPHEMRDKIEVPGYAGLYILGHAGWGIETIKRPKLLHREKVSDAFLLKKTKAITWRYWRKSTVLSTAR